MDPRGVTMKEAARMLGVGHTKMWLLVKEGTLPSYTNPLDRRQRLIPEEAIRRLLAVPNGNKRPRPRTLGIVSDGALPARDIEEYTKAYWRPQ